MNKEAFISGFLKKVEKAGMDKNAFMLPLLATLGSSIGGMVGAERLAQLAATRGMQRGGIKTLGTMGTNAIENEQKRLAYNKALSGAKINPTTTPQKPDWLDWLGQKHLDHPGVMANVGGMVAPMVTDPIVNKLLEKKDTQQPQGYEGYPQYPQYPQGGMY